MRYLNPQRSKSLQDRKGWIEGWEPRIKADEFIHGLGIGEAYLRHNGRPAKVKLIRAEINPPRDFDLSADLPRFSQGNEPPLNLTEKVNRVVMERMREAKRNDSKDDDRNVPHAAESKRKRQKEKTQYHRNSPKEISPTITKGETPEVTGQPCDRRDPIPSAPDILAQQSAPSTRPKPQGARDRSNGLLPKTGLAEPGEKLEWDGSWEDNISSDNISLSRGDQDKKAEI